MVKQLLVCSLGIDLGACFQPMKPSTGHLSEGPRARPRRPFRRRSRPFPQPPRPKPTARAETYSVVVNNVSVRELLFALARDAKVNVDIHSGITGICDAERDRPDAAAAAQPHLQAGRHALRARRSEPAS